MENGLELPRGETLLPLLLLAGLVILVHGVMARRDGVRDAGRACGLVIGVGDVNVLIYCFKIAIFSAGLEAEF